MITNSMHSQSRVFVPEVAKTDYMKGRNLYFARISDHHIIAMADGIPNKVRKCLNAVPFGYSTGGKHVRVSEFQNGRVWFMNDEESKILHIFKD